MNRHSKVSDHQLTGQVWELDLRLVKCRMQRANKSRHQRLRNRDQLIGQESPGLKLHQEGQVEARAKLTTSSRRGQIDLPASFPQDAKLVGCRRLKEVHHVEDAETSSHQSTTSEVLGSR